MNNRIEEQRQSANDASAERNEEDPLWRAIHQIEIATMFVHNPGYYGVFQELVDGMSDLGREDGFRVVRRHGQDVGVYSFRV